MKSLAASAALVLIAAPVFAQLPTPTPLALTNRVPAGVRDSIYSGFDLPVISNAGQVAFRATLSGGSTTAGLFTGGGPARSPRSRSRARPPPARAARPTRGTSATWS